jgi:hypothetical protein
VLLNLKRFTGHDEKVCSAVRGLGSAVTLAFGAREGAFFVGVFFFNLNPPSLLRVWLPLYFRKCEFFIKGKSGGVPLS